ncbi:hypothetical protein FHW96_002874 [Novosphingobium sp. SG751A]|uniref:phage tail protein n=1 Tax=Novosphingobium sp. SG751A TaxID=2587000 RepID=UPI0015550907|nr:phage tail protein [Novosphingobium sp. SG751A]NOW46714.1 hypothetical protein [Novosphingobium sp. SG751A]
MLKINLLRAALMQAMPELKASPKSLIMWVDRGKAVSRDTADLSFTFEFQLNVLLIEFAGDIAAFALAILIWLRTNQPDLFAMGADAFDFETDILDNGKADVQIRLQLRQNVEAVVTPNGVTATYLPEPDPLFPDDLPLGGLDAMPLLKSITVNDEDLPPDNAMGNAVDGG